MHRLTETNPRRKVAIVTGAASGIGLATAKRFAQTGYDVVIADLDVRKSEAAREQIRQASPEAGVLVSECDVSQEEQVEETVRRTLDRFRGVETIVNNAGLMVFKRIEEHTTEDWVKTLKVDLLGAFYFIRQGFLHMKPGASIVNVSSIHARETTPLVAAYAAAKAALVSLTNTAAIEGKPKGIRVNAVLPGAVDTPMLLNNPNVRAGLEVVHQSDVGTPEDIAAAIEFLASDDARFIQGASLSVDGGRLSHL
jgi:NAD(P)-dependent dehydrogenase (short-subunit alcohol dehydrogenase family)